MSGANTYNPAEADLLEQATKDLSLAEYDAVWRVYVERGYDAAAMVAAATTKAFKTRYKVVDVPRVKAYDPATDFLARAFGADQAK